MIETGQQEQRRECLEWMKQQIVNVWCAIFPLLAGRVPPPTDYDDCSTFTVAFAIAFDIANWDVVHRVAVQ